VLERIRNGRPPPTWTRAWSWRGYGNSRRVTNGSCDGGGTETAEELRVEGAMDGVRKEPDSSEHMGSP